MSIYIAPILFSAKRKYTEHSISSLRKSLDLGDGWV